MITLNPFDLAPFEKFGRATLPIFTCPNARVRTSWGVGSRVDAQYARGRARVMGFRENEFCDQYPRLCARHEGLPSEFPEQYARAGAHAMRC
jgi:hypothetical protein